MNIRLNKKEFPHYGKYIGKGIYEIHDKYFEDPSLFWETKEENRRRIEFLKYQTPLWIFFIFISLCCMLITYIYEHIDSEVMSLHMYDDTGPEKDPVAFVLYYIVAKVHLTTLKHFRKFNCYVEDKPLESDIGVEWIFQHEETPEKVNEKYKWKKEYKEFKINLQRNNLNYLLVHVFPEFLRRLIWLFSRLLLIIHAILYFFGNNDDSWGFIKKIRWIRNERDYSIRRSDYQRAIY